MTLSFTDWERNRVLVLNLSGRLTAGEGTRALRQRISDLLAAGKKEIVLNLGEVSYIDSSGLAELVAAYTAVAKQGGRVKLAKLSTRTEKLLQMTKLHSVFDIHPDDESALANFAS